MISSILTTCGSLRSFLKRRASYEAAQMLCFVQFSMCTMNSVIKTGSSLLRLIEPKHCRQRLSSRRSYVIFLSVSFVSTLKIASRAYRSLQISQQPKHQFQWHQLVTPEYKLSNSDHCCTNWEPLLREVLEQNLPSFAQEHSDINIVFVKMHAVRAAGLGPINYLQENALSHACWNKRLKHNDKKSFNIGTFRLES